jgi:hypothetical protein
MATVSRLLGVMLLIWSGTVAAQSVYPMIPNPPHPYPAVAQVISAFESEGEWGSNGTLDTTLKVEGQSSLRWKVDDGTLVLDQSFDLTDYDGLSFWLHSNQSDRHRFLIYLESENDETSGGDYYSFMVSVDWIGWRQVTIPFPDFKSNRSPMGLHHIDSVRMYSQGWGMTPDPNAVIHLDDLRASGYAYPPTSTDPEVVVFDWRNGADHAATWHKLLEDDHIDQEYPSLINVVAEPLFTSESYSLRYRVHSGEDIRPYYPDDPDHNATNMRSEHHSNGGAYGADMGDTVWWRFTYRWEKLDRDRPMTLWQWRNQRPGVTGGPGVELQFRPVDERLEIVGNGWAVPWQDTGVLVDDTVENRWYDFICTITYSTSNGAARCWVDGELKWDYSGPTVEEPDHDAMHIRNGLYRWRAVEAFLNGELDLTNGEMISYQGPTAFAINVDDGFQKMLDAFPSWIFKDGFESGDPAFWSLTDAD